MENKSSKSDRQNSQLEDLHRGIGWSSDKTLARYFDTSRQRIWAWSREGRIPKPYKISANMTRWCNAAIKQYQDRGFI